MSILFLLGFFAFIFGLNLIGVLRIHRPLAVPLLTFVFRAGCFGLALWHVHDYPDALFSHIKLPPSAHCYLLPGLTGDQIVCPPGRLHSPPGDVSLGFKFLLALAFCWPITLGVPFFVLINHFVFWRDRHHKFFPPVHEPEDAHQLREAADLGRQLASDISDEKVREKYLSHARLLEELASKIEANNKDAETI